MDIKRIVKEINNGNLVITPTDTVYGILASSKEYVVNKVYEAKKRSKNKSFIVLISSYEMLDSIVDNVTDIHKDLMDRYWPGMLTIIFDKKDGGTIGVRYPNHKELLEIIDLVGEPLISTSVNISGHGTITSIKEIDSELMNYISYIEDNGVIDSKSSTIVMVVDDNVKILRDGLLGEDIRKNYNVID